MFLVKARTKLFWRAYFMTPYSKYYTKLKAYKDNKKPGKHTIIALSFELNAGRKEDKNAVAL